MPDRETEKVPADQRTATHGGEGGTARDSGHLEPGSGLERRQDRNEAQTRKGDDGKGAHSGRTDTRNP